MAHRKIKSNYRILSNYDFYTPGPVDIIILLLLFLAGALLGGVISAPFAILMPDNPNAMMYTMLVSYPVMFIPPMMYSAYKSHQNSFFGKGYKLSNGHYTPLGIAICAVLVMVVTLTTSFLADALISMLPPMPDRLESILSSITGGNFLLNFICVSIFAPFFEEWLCRGMILRGLLNYEHKDKDGEKTRGIKPVWAIIISAAIFALIHANQWQGIAAFSLGLLFGYVYYRTGSLWLTMLMHFTNNTFALVMSHIDSLEEAENFREIMPGSLYWAVIAFCVAFLVYFIHKFLVIKPLHPQGSCAELASE